MRRGYVRFSKCEGFDTLTGSHVGHWDAPIVSFVITPVLGTFYRISVPVRRHTFVLLAVCAS